MFFLGDLFCKNDSIGINFSFRGVGWEIGVGPSLVFVDEGVARTLTSTTARSDIYAFIFGQEGLMAGLGIQGTRIKSIDPD